MLLPPARRRRRRHPLPYRQRGAAAAANGDRRARPVRVSQSLRRQHLLPRRAPVRLRLYPLWLDRARPVAGNQGHRADRALGRPVDQQRQHPAVALRCHRWACRRRARRTGRRRRRPGVYDREGRRTVATGRRSDGHDRRPRRLPAERALARHLFRFGAVGAVDGPGDDTGSRAAAAPRRTGVRWDRRRARRIRWHSRYRCRWPSSPRDHEFATPPPYNASGSQAYPAVFYPHRGRRPTRRPLSSATATAAPASIFNCVPSPPHACPGTSTARPAGRPSFSCG